MRGQASVMQSWCASAVDAACLGFYHLRKVARLHGPKPRHEGFDGLDLVEIKCTPQSKRLALVARWAGALNSRNILARNISVCGGRCSAHEWSLMHPIFFCRFRLAPQTNIPPPGRSTRTVQGVHLILEQRAPMLDVAPSFLLMAAGLPTTSSQYIGNACQIWGSIRAVAVKRRQSLN